MKLQLMLIMVLLIVPIVYTLEDCERIMNPGDVPCLLKSAWDYPNDCNTYTIDIYNENLTLIRTATMSDYGSLSKYCNITFGINSSETELGSYLLNFSNKDTVLITIKGDDTMTSLSVTLFFGAITLALFFLGIKGNFSKNPVANLIFKRVFILGGMFLLTLDTTMIVTMADNAGLGINREIFRYMWGINWTIYLFMVWLIWTTVLNVIKMWEVISKREREGLGSEDEYL